MKRSGFSLTEISLVAVVIGIVTAIVSPNYVKARNKAEQNACIANMREVEGAVQMWVMDSGQFSATPTEAQLVPDYIKKWPACRGVPYAVPAANAETVCPNSVPGHVLTSSDAGS